MIKALFILTLIISSCTVAQQSVGKKAIIKQVAKWKSNNEFGVVKYQVQRSASKVIWTTLANGTFTPKYKPDSNIYIFILPATSNPYYYRISATMGKGKPFNTAPFYLKSTKN